MAQVVQQSYSNVSRENIKDERVNSFTISKQTIYTTLTGIVLGAWLIASYLNNMLFFKEALCSSLIIFFLVFVNSKSTKTTSIEK